MESLVGGGAEKVLVDILQNFDFDHYSVDLLLLTRKGIYLNSIPKEVKVNYLFENESWPYIILFKILKIIEAKWFMKKFISLFIAKEYDSIISFMEARSLRIHNYITEKTNNNVTWVHVDLKEMHWSKNEFLNIEQETLAYHKMNTIVVVSNQLKKSIKTLFGEACNIKVIWNPIDINKIKKHEAINHEKKKYLSFCSVGRLAKQKRFDRLIEIAKILKSEGRKATFNIIGMGGMYNELAKSIKDNGVEDMVYLKGFISPPYEEMSKNDVYICSSHTEGFPLVVCEAISIGLPVISTDICGPHEILLDEKNNIKYGLLVNNNLNSLYEGVKMIIDNPLLLKGLKEGSLKRREIFNINKTMNQIYSII